MTCGRRVYGRNKEEESCEAEGKEDERRARRDRVQPSIAQRLSRHDHLGDQEDGSDLVSELSARDESSRTLQTQTDGRVSGRG